MKLGKTFPQCHHIRSMGNEALDTHLIEKIFCFFKPYGAIQKVCHSMAHTTKKDQAGWFIIYSDFSKFKKFRLFAPPPLHGFSRSRFTCGAHLARSINKNIIRIFSHFSLYCRLYGNKFYMTSHEPALVSPTDWVIACAQTKITKQAILQIFRCDTCSDSYMVLFIIIKTEHH